MKKIRFVFFVVAALCVQFASAQTVNTQENAGGGGADIASANYTAKAAVALPGVGVSQSANYFYDHGTVWFEGGALPPPPPPVIPPSGGSSGSSVGGGSGSGWLPNFFGGETGAGIGGVSPAVDTAPVIEAVQELPRAEEIVVPQTEMPVVIARAAKDMQPISKIIRGVDATNTVRELAIILTKRVMPWFLWLALALMLLGIGALIIFTAWKGSHEALLWLASILIVGGIILVLSVRIIYRDVVRPIDAGVTESLMVRMSDLNAAVKSIMRDLPLGFHRMTVIDDADNEVLQITFLITPLFPFK